ncbi:hypothetical protein K469DRAFT_692033 [Zopfia rhizophila CBS 207.26]|uniref:SH3 domain-containing protein n=1 Tax=Zopfia rhizophila CBS 207.26 TaxID=1314779 RepID=A0A6A6DTM5_9PEZI|nr:hypothetical protein K469DRAFT_692033 [Zopfia rhizophila CBS 207.26]
MSTPSEGSFARADDAVPAYPPPTQPDPASRIQDLSDIAATPSQLATNSYGSHQRNKQEGALDNGMPAMAPASPAVKRKYGTIAPAPPLLQPHMWPGYLHTPWYGHTPDGQPLPDGHNGHNGYDYDYPAQHQYNQPHQQVYVSPYDQQHASINHQRAPAYQQPGDNPDSPYSSIEPDNAPLPPHFPRIPTPSDEGTPEPPLYQHQYQPPLGLHAVWDLPPGQCPHPSTLSDALYRIHANAKWISFRHRMPDLKYHFRLEIFKGYKIDDVPDWFLKELMCGGAGGLAKRDPVLRRELERRGFRPCRITSQVGRDQRANGKSGNGNGNRNGNTIANHNTHSHSHPHPHPVPSPNGNGNGNATAPPTQTTRNGTAPGNDRASTSPKKRKRGSRNEDQSYYQPLIGQFVGGEKVTHIPKAPGYTKMRAPRHNPTDDVDIPIDPAVLESGLPDAGHQVVSERNGYQYRKTFREKKEMAAYADSHTPITKPVVPASLESRYFGRSTRPEGVDAFTPTPRHTAHAAYRNEMRGMDNGAAWPARRQFFPFPDPREVAARSGNGSRSGEERLGGEGGVSFQPIRLTARETGNTWRDRNVDMLERVDEGRGHAPVIDLTGCGANAPLIDLTTSFPDSSATASRSLQSRKRPKYRAVRDHQYQTTNHYVGSCSKQAFPRLLLKKGDLVWVSEKLESGWWYANHIEDCTTGWVPGFYLEEDRENEDGANVSRPAASYAPEISALVSRPIAPRARKHSKYRAIWDHHLQTAGTYASNQQHTPRLILNQGDLVSVRFPESSDLSCPDHATTSSHPTGFNDNYADDVGWGFATCLDDSVSGWVPWWVLEEVRDEEDGGNEDRIKEFDANAPGTSESEAQTTGTLADVTPAPGSSSCAPAQEPIALGANASGTRATETQAARTHISSDTALAVTSAPATSSAPPPPPPPTSFLNPPPPAPTNPLNPKEAQILSASILPFPDAPIPNPAISAHLPSGQRLLPRIQDLDLATGYPGARGPSEANAMQFEGVEMDMWWRVQGWVLGGAMGVGYV